MRFRPATAATFKSGEVVACRQFVSSCRRLVTGGASRQWRAANCSSSWNTFSSVSPDDKLLPLPAINEYFRSEITLFRCEKIRITGVSLLSRFSINVYVSILFDPFAFCINFMLSPFDILQNLHVYIHTYILLTYLLYDMFNCWCCCCCCMLYFI